MKALTAVALALAVAAPVAAQTPVAPPAQAPAPATASRPLATVDGKDITEAEVEALLGSALTDLRNQEYTLKKRALDELVARRLVEMEARRRGITEEELQRAEITAKVVAPTEEEKTKLYEENKSRLGAMTAEEALRRAGEFLQQQRERERRVAFVGELKRKSATRILLDAPRHVVSVDDDPVKGTATAPVTIVEFSDFQCPFCSRAVPTLKQIEQRYGDKVRIVFRDLPLTSIHKDAAKAAEAASCANEHGKFWEMHDRLFANQSLLGVEELKKHAEAVGVPAEPFAKCLDSGKYAAEWQKDTEAAQQAGVSSTPAFFVNGRLLTGAQPLDAFVEVIDEELQRAGVAPPAEPAAQ
jgi:protein-disulfide isomerase